MFIIYILTIVIAKAYNLGIADFDQFKALLVLGETIFAAYVGQIVHAMFNAGPTVPAEPSGASEAQENGRRGLCPTIAMRCARKCAQILKTVSRRCRPGLVQGDRRARLMLRSFIAIPRNRNQDQAPSGNATVPCMLLRQRLVISV